MVSAAPCSQQVHIKLSNAAGKSDCCTQPVTLCRACNGHQSLRVMDDIERIFMQCGLTSECMDVSKWQAASGEEWGPFSMHSS